MGGVSSIFFQINVKAIVVPFDGEDKRTFNLKGKSGCPPGFSSAFLSVGSSVINKIRFPEMAGRWNVLLVILSTNSVTHFTVKNLEERTTAI